MDSSIIKIKGFVNNVPKVVKLVLEKEQINVIPVNQIQILNSTIYKKVQVHVFNNVKRDNMGKIRLINVRTAIIHA